MQRASEVDRPADELIGLLAARRGHFRLESGHHGELWLDLERLYVRPSHLRRLTDELARRLARYEVEAVCGPLVGGAFVAEMIAAELDKEFYYSELLPNPGADSLYSARYRFPDAVRPALAGKAVAIVDDVISAGSSVRATVADLETCGAIPRALGALLVLGNLAQAFADEKGIPLESISRLPYRLWTPQECPTCASGVPLDGPRKAGPGRPRPASRQR